MGWALRFKASVEKDLKKIAPKEVEAIFDGLSALLDDPRGQGRPLKGDKKGLWRYRFGSYRVICDLQDEVLTVLVVRVGHRKDVYQ